MSRIRLVINKILIFITNVITNIIASGRVPNHIAFIMDGNRRFAVKKNIQKQQGHSAGSFKMEETVEWCNKLGIREITTYAFSIENFERNSVEVEVLMNLMKKTMKKILDGKKYMDNGICFRVVGNWSLIPADLRTLIAKVMLKTKDNTNSFINIAFSYTSQDEMTTAIRDILQGVEEGLLNKEDISEELMDQTMQISAPELLIRTSGEVRLSDFLLWQISDTCLYFTKVLWPDFNEWNLLKSILYFQRNYNPKRPRCTELNERCLNFLNKQNEKKWSLIEQYSQES